MTTQTSQGNQPEQTRKDLEVSLITKAWTDETFKQRLLNNPRTTVEQELGEQLPEGMNVQIIQEPANTLYIVLPTKPESSDKLSGGLKDEELEAVAGGAGFRARLRNHAEHSAHGHGHLGRKLH